MTPRSSATLERVADAEAGAAGAVEHEHERRGDVGLVALRDEEHAVAIGAELQRLLADADADRPPRPGRPNPSAAAAPPAARNVAPGHLRHVPRMLAHTTLHDPHLRRRLTRGSARDRCSPRRRRAQQPPSAAALAGGVRRRRSAASRSSWPSATCLARRGASSSTAGSRTPAQRASATSRPRRRWTPTRVFRIASMTKSFTAMSILKLRDEGKLSLDDPAERYVPEMAGLKYPIDATRRRSPSAICCRTPKAFPRTTRGAIASSPTPTSSCRRCCAAAFRSRTRPASPTSTPTSASPSSAASSPTCRRCSTRTTSPRTSCGRSA